jgi:hypothetical protein
MTDLEAPIVIDSKRHGKRTFHPVRMWSYRTAAGRVGQLSIWEGSCVVCGAPFEIVAAGAPEQSGAFGTTTCKPHRRAIRRRTPE